MGKLIAVIGPSGIGKTTLVRVLAQKGGFATALEQHDERPFQALFKQDPRYGLANQIDFFLLRASQERALRASSQTGLIDGGLDLDFHGFTRLFYQRELLSEHEFELCHRLYAMLRASLPEPELFIRLRADQRTVTSRISMRTRINIASMEDFTLFDALLDEWLEVLDADHFFEVNVTEDDQLYSHLVPRILAGIEERFGKI